MRLKMASSETVGIYCNMGTKLEVKVVSYINATADLLSLYNRYQRGFIAPVIALWFGANCKLMGNFKGY